jgi:uncharacterized membrane protein YhaH (DUF805 family)
MPLILRPIAKYAVFTGRARRAEYWQFLLLQVFVYICLGILFGMGMGQGHNLVQTLGGLVIAVAVFALFCLLPNLAVTVRRLHDTGKSAWWLLLYLIPFANLGMIWYQIAWAKAHDITDLHEVGHNPLLGLAGLASRIYLLYLMRKSGDVGPNAYGPDPKQPLDIAAVFDAPEPVDEDMAPRRPVFDFGPATTSPPAAFRPTPMQAPTRQAPAAPVFGKRRP